MNVKPFHILISVVNTIQNQKGRGGLGEGMCGASILASERVERVKNKEGLGGR